MEEEWIKTFCIKNRTCYYFDDTIKLEDFNLDNIVIDKKSHENVLTYGISCKTLIGSKPLRIRFKKIPGFIRIYDGTRYLKLFRYEKFDAVYDSIKYIISLESSITYIFSYYFAKVQIDFYDYLTIEKTLTLYNVIILIKLLLNKNKNHYYYKIFLKKCSNQSPKK